MVSMSEPAYVSSNKLSKPTWNDYLSYKASKDGFYVWGGGLADVCPMSKVYNIISKQTFQSGNVCSELTANAHI